MREKLQTTKFDRLKNLIICCCSTKSVQCCKHGYNFNHITKENSGKQRDKILFKGVIINEIYKL